MPPDALDTTPDTGDPTTSAPDAATLLADLVEVLLPGGDGWPSGRTVGVQALLALRLLEGRGKAEFTGLTRALLEAGGPLALLDEEGRIAVVRRLEIAEPDLFGWVRDAAYIVYYENPFVAEVINAKGNPYELRPHLKGYAVPRFDLDRDMPRHGRGRYTPTGAVTRVDTSALDLDGRVTQTWGLKR